METAPLVEVLGNDSNFGSVPSSPLIDPREPPIVKVEILLLRLFLSRLIVLYKWTVRTSAAHPGVVWYVNWRMVRGLFLPTVEFKPHSRRMLFLLLFSVRRMLVWLSHLFLLETI